MIDVEVEHGIRPELTADMVRAQLETILRDDGFRSSKRSVAFLKYVVEQTLRGAADQIKERTIGIEVFDRDPSYETNLDHIVRTGATELRKRLAAYYVDERHRHELRITLIPGSYIPRFSLPGAARTSDGDLGDVSGEVSSGSQSAPSQATQPKARTQSSRVRLWMAMSAIVVILAASASWLLFPPTNPQDLFWKPVLETPGPVLVAVGDHPNGPPTLPESSSGESATTPVPSSDASQTVPFSDTVTIAKVVGSLEAKNKQVLIRRGNSSSFSDLREGAAVLVGAFNNEWSLRLTRQLRYSLSLDEEKHLIYIRDAKAPNSRTWSWATNQPREPKMGVNSPPILDYALISRLRDPGTGHVVVVIGGLYTYGTLAAGEFLTDPNLMREIDHQLRKLQANQNLQIILETTVTDGTPGPPHVVAVSSE